jgi:hypothetical protein
MDMHIWWCHPHRYVEIVNGYLGMQNRGKGSSQRKMKGRRTVLASSGKLLAKKERN